MINDNSPICITQYDMINDKQYIRYQLILSHKYDKYDKSRTCNILLNLSITYYLQRASAEFKSIWALKFFPLTVSIVRHLSSCFRKTTFRRLLSNPLPF